MKLKIYNRTIETSGRFIATFISTPRDSYVHFADGFNLKGSFETIDVESVLPKSLYNYFEQLGLHLFEESHASVHTSLYTICDPSFFTHLHMARIFIIQLLNNDQDFHIVEIIENPSDWFNRFPYPKEN